MILSLGLLNATDNFLYGHVALCSYFCIQCLNLDETKTLHIKIYCFVCSMYVLHFMFRPKSVKPAKRQCVAVEGEENKRCKRHKKVSLILAIILLVFFGAC